MIKKPAWPVWISSVLVALAVFVMLRSDLAHLNWVSALSMQGSPPPERDPSSPTGYVLGQRQFLGSHERGETYRWIAAIQDFIARGPLASASYQADNVPEGRAQLLPRLYTAWLAAVSWGLHVITGEPVALSVERAALWEPVITHILAFAAIVGFIGIRHGATAAGVAGLFFVLFPPLSGQFLPGVLTPRTWALLFAAYAIAINLPSNGWSHQRSAHLGIRAALAASLALWLDPAFGFPAVLLSAAAGVGAMLVGGTKPCFLQWSLIGSGLTLVAWVVDRSPWDAAAGELRYVHPLYALAWLGLGVGLDGWQGLRSTTKRRRWRWLEAAMAIALLAPLVYTQLKQGYKGWLYSGPSMRRLTSLDETRMFDTAFAWLAQASVAEIVLFTAPVLAAAATLVVLLWPKRQARSERSLSLVVAAAILAGLLLVSLFQIRWAVVASLIVLPLLASLIIPGSSAAARGATWAISAAFLFALLAWGRNPPAAWQRPSGDAVPSQADLEALIHRHFSHWLASHTPGQDVSALAPPELSDSLVFHGGCRVLMSTAWESYVGLVAVSRILSAPEASEAEAVLESRKITHVVLTSWDRALPLIVKQPDLEGRETLYARLQRWVHPRYLRPIPYRLPSVPGFLDQKLAVFKMTPPQDEALSLSRLAEYFLEVERSEPAGLVAKELKESFPDDPNAAIARAMVYAHANDQAGFEHELDRLAADVAADRVPFLWDRRVQRAIVLALGGRHDLAHQEIEACLAEASEEVFFDLTALQAHRMEVLVKSYGLTFPDPALARLVASLGAEYSASRASSPAR